MNTSKITIVNLDNNIATLSIPDNTPIYGCHGCQTTGGRATCMIHGQKSMTIGSIYPLSHCPTCRCYFP